MEYYTAPGQGYVILTAGGTITSPDGIFSLTLDAGQTYFRATTDKIIVSDASAILCPVAKWPGMQPVSVTILGEGTVSGDVPASYIVCSFLESTGDQIIDTGLTLDSTSVIRSTSRTPATTAGQWEALYDTDYYMGAYYVNAQFCFIIYDENVNNICYSTYTTDTVYTIEQAYDSITINGEKLTYSDLGSGIVYDPTKPLCLFNRAGGSNPGKSRLMSLSVTKGGNKVGDYVPVLNEAGVPCMYDKVSGEAKLNEGEGSFIVGMTAEQARLLGNLPEGGSTLTISLPPDVVNENGVLQDVAIFAALSAATAKGWSFILQTYDGTAVETEVPLEYMQCEFLESAGAQYINTEYSLHYDSFAEIDTQQTLLPANSFKGGLLGGDTTNNYFAIWNSVWKEGYPRFDYNSNVLTNKFSSHVSGRAIFKKVAYQNFINGENFGDNTIPTETPTWEVKNVALFSATLSSNYAFYGRIFSAKIGRADVIGRDFIPAIDKNGKPCMYDKVSKTSFVNVNTTEGAVDFVAGMTAAQAVQLANLPEDAIDKNITVSLPQSILNDAGEITDAAVRAALNKAADNGWDITLQYYTEQ